MDDLSIRSNNGFTFDLASENELINKVRKKKFENA